MRDNDKIFSLYKKRMTVAAVTSSVCYGLIIGGGVAFIAALLSWLLSYNGVWIAVGTGLGSAIISGILLFFFKFRPNEHSVARRMDTMGLEERTITMYDLQNTDSPIAEIQRRDACDKIQNVSQSQIKTAFPVFAAGKVAAVCLGVALCAAIGMTLVTGLTEAGVIPGPGIVVAEQDRFVTVSYAVQNDEGGEIEGEFEQIISPGESTEPVAAVAEDGWIFVRWSDGVLTTERQDTNVEEDKEIFAIFEEIGDGEDEDADDPLDNENEGDYDQNAPNPDKNDGAGNSGDVGNGGEGESDNGSQGDGNGTGEGGQEGQGHGDGKGEGAGGGWSDSNQIIDGSTDYRDVFDTYYDMAMEIIKNGGELPQELREFIEKYFGSL